jgi:nucleoside-diphosphate-sugar epimerase
MKKIFITGGAGFIGSEVSNLFTSNGHHVVAFDSFETYLVPNSGSQFPSPTSRLKASDYLTITRGNILNKYHLEHAILDQEPNILIHAASLPLANISINMTEEAYDSILTSTLNLLEIIRRNKLKTKLIFLSSSMVYGDFKKTPVKEDHPTQPKEIYGTLKLMAEKLIEAYGKRHDISYSIIRPSAVYGPGDRNARVIFKFARAAIDGKSITVDGDGENLADFTNIKDIGRAIYLCALSNNTDGKIYNATTGASVSLNDVLRVLRSEYPNLDVCYGEKPDYVPMRGTLDINRLRSDAGYQPETSTLDGIRKYLHHLQDNIF